MKGKITISKAILLLVAIIVCVTVIKYHFYINLLLVGAPKYPTGYPLENMVVYKINPETILTSLDQDKTDVFMPALENPIYDNVPPLEPSTPFQWNQEDSLMVANALHQFVWNESLDGWYLYSLGVLVPNCREISQNSGVGFSFYKRQENWRYFVHEVDVDLEYGFVYAGDNNGYYTGVWTDIDLDKVKVNNFEKALQIAEQSGGRDARLALKDIQNCYININFPLPVYKHTDWKWEVAYRVYDSNTTIFRSVIDPYTGNYENYTQSK